MQGRRLEFLDALRGVAAIAVVVQHGAERWWPGFDAFSREWFDLGRFGVCAFFLVSGFIIPTSLEGEGSVGRFWVGRVFRLYPAYWLSIGALLLVSVWEPTTFSPEYQAHQAWYTLVNLTMLEQLVGVPMASGIYYTLTIELCFYVACTVLFAAGLLRRSYALAVAAVVVLGATSVVAPLLLDRRLPAAIPFYLATLFVGTVLYRWSEGDVSTRAAGALLTAVGVVGALTTWVSYDHFGVEEAGKQFAFAGAFLPWLAAYACFLGALAARRHAFPRGLLFLGLISYSVYLLHPAVLAVVGDWHQHVLALTVLLVATVGLAALAYRLVEAPSIATGRRIRRRLRQGADHPR